MYQTLLNHIKNTYPEITDEDFNMIIKTTSYKEYCKKTTIWSEGDYLKDIAFVIKGCFRYFNTNKEGEERNTHFAVEDWWIGDLNSIMDDQPALQSIEVLEDSKVLSIKKSDYKNLIENCVGFRRFTQKKRDRAYAATVKRLADMNERAEIRYENLIKKYPDALNRIPLYHIASYLGIEPESLSRLRKSMAQSKKSHKFLSI